MHCKAAKQPAQRSTMHALQASKAPQPLQPLQGRTLVSAPLATNSSTNATCPPLHALWMERGAARGNSRALIRCTKRGRPAATRHAPSRPASCASAACCAGACCWPSCMHRCKHGHTLCPATQSAGVDPARNTCLHARKLEETEVDTPQSRFPRPCFETAFTQWLERHWLLAPTPAAKPHLLRPTLSVVPPSQHCSNYPARHAGRRRRAAAAGSLRPGAVVVGGGGGASRVSAVGRHAAPAAPRRALPAALRRAQQLLAEPWQRACTGQAQGEMGGLLSGCCCGCAQTWASALADATRAPSSSRPADQRHRGQPDADVPEPRASACGRQGAAAREEGGRSRRVAMCLLLLVAAPPRCPQLAAPLPSPPCCSYAGGWHLLACARGLTRWPTCMAWSRAQVGRRSYCFRLPAARQLPAQLSGLTAPLPAGLRVAPAAPPPTTRHMHVELACLDACPPTCVAPLVPHIRRPRPPLSPPVHPCPDPTAPAIFIGSHYDTVVDGGKYDGALGIVVGIAAVKALLIEVRRVGRVRSGAAASGQQGSQQHLVVCRADAGPGCCCGCSSSGCSSSACLPRRCTLPSPRVGTCETRGGSCGVPGRDTRCAGSRRMLPHMLPSWPTPTGRGGGGRGFPCRG